MKKIFSILLGIILLLSFSVSSANDTGSLSVTLKPGLNTFSTPAIVKSISFSNGGNNISFATMEEGEWIPIKFTNNNVQSIIYPLNGYIVRNDNVGDVIMNIVYDTGASFPSTFSKTLDAGWNFLGITKTDIHFDFATMKYDLTNGGDTNLIQLGVNYLDIARFMLTKAYVVFVNSNGVYESENIYGSGGGSEGDIITKPECNILLDPTELTSGNVILTISGSSFVTEYSWSGDIVDNYSSNKQETVSSNGMYTGYVKDVNGNTGSCNIIVSNIDKEGPSISFSDTGFYININETGSTFDSNTILRYKWLTGDEICGDVPNSGYLTGELESVYTSYWKVETKTDFLVNDDYYLCVFENSIRDKAGNGNIATKSAKFTIVNNNISNPTCDIIPSITEPTKGEVVLTISGSEGIQAVSRDGLDWSTVYNNSNQTGVKENGIYTGYVTDGKLTGSCSIVVSNIDKIGPNVEFYPNGGSGVTGVVVMVRDTNDLRSDSKIKYRWQNGSTCSINRSNYTELSITKTGDDKSGYASMPIDGLDGEYYLCILKNTIYDILGNSNIAARSDKFIFEVNNSGNECQEICKDDGLDCPDECRVGILSNNSKGNVSLLINGSSKKSVYEGNLTANGRLKLDYLNIYGNSLIPEGDILFFDVYIDGTKRLSFQLTGGSNGENGINKQYPISMMLTTGITVSLEIKAKISGVNEGVDYNYEFKLLGTDIEFYAINPQTIFITVVGDDENGDDISNDDFMEVYNWANEKGILDNQIITNANLNKKINDIELITFITDYAKNILNREIDETRDCSFVNTGTLSDAEFSSLLESCKLGLIQSGDGMTMDGSRSTMSMLATLLSRSLRGDKYDGEEPYYQGHLDALKLAGIFTGTINPDKSGLKGDVLVALMNSEGKDEHRRVANSYDFLMNDFNAVEDVYHGIKPGDRVIFLVRHSERIRNCTSEGGLTEHGIELARGVGEKLQGIPFEDTSTDFYGSSTVKRTVQTSYYVGENRGSDVLEDVLDDDAWYDYNYVNHSSDINDVVNGNYFSDRGNINEFYEYNKDVVAQKSLYAINKLCDITDGHPFSWITSHDWYTLPITERATNETLSFNWNDSDRDWPNFMQGVAIIVHEDGGWEIYPVRSLDTGKIKLGDNPGC